MAKRVWALAVACLLGLGLTACGGEPAGPAAPVTFSFTLADGRLADGAADVSPAEEIGAAVTDGTIDDVTLADTRGNVIDGELDASGRGWRSTGDLAYNRSYTLTVTARDANGAATEQTREFSTVSPSDQTLVYLRTRVSGGLLDGGTFGVGQPIVAWFDSAVTDKAAAERALVVTSDPPVEGAWRWFNGDHEAHWRPKEYWPAGATVTVHADIFGVDLGDGLFGQEDQTATFTIGPSHVAVADSLTHRMKVFVDGEQVTTIDGKDVSEGIAVSLGMDGGEQGTNGWVDFRTNSGPHVVLAKSDEVHMTSASFGIYSGTNFYDLNVAKAVQISADGEYVHYANWNIPAHGRSNTSHGCINVDEPYIGWFYDTFDVGDVVEVTNTGKTLALDNGLGDWTLSWDEWLQGSFLA